MKYNISPYLTIFDNIAPLPLSFHPSPVKPDPVQMGPDVT